MMAETVDISTLSTDAGNVRAHGTRNLDSVKASLVKFGQQKPIVVDAKGVVVAGNATLEAARALGWKKIDVVRTKLKGRSKTAYAIADNRTAELAEWDEGALAAALADMQKDGNFDHLVAGFTDAEIDQLVADATGISGVVEDDVPEVQAEAVTRPGDLWLLGEHRVLCGDATHDDDVACATNRVNVAAVLTDPPYGIGYKYESHNDARELWFGLMDSVIPKLRSIAPITVMPCCGIDRIDWWYANHRPDWMICWYKGSPGHRSHIGFNDWEAHLVWGKPPKQMHDYFQTACGFDVDGQPCPKPVAWGAWLCERVCEAGAMLLDPFLGSGTTLIAAEQLNRKCCGIEIEPKYVDVVCRRWMNLTGKEPTLESTGETFAQRSKAKEIPCET